MADPITLFGITLTALMKDAGISAAIGGVIGNRFDHHSCNLVNASWKKIKNIWSKDELPKNENLARALREAQLLSTLYMVNALNNILGFPYGLEHKQHQKQFRHSFNEWFKEQKANLKGDFLSFYDDPSYTNIEILMAAEEGTKVEEFRKEICTQAKDSLWNELSYELPKHGLQFDIPDAIKNGLYNGWNEDGYERDWFDIMTLNFATILKNPDYQAAQIAFETRVLSDIKVDTRIIKLDLSNIKKSVEGLDTLKDFIYTKWDILDNIKVIGNETIAYTKETNSIVKDLSDSIKSLIPYSPSVVDNKYEKDLPKIAESLKNIGEIFLSVKDFEKAKPYYLEILKIKKILSESGITAFNIRDEIELLLNLGTIHLKENDVTHAQSFFEEAVQKSFDLNNKKVDTFFIKILIRIGGTYFEVDNKEKAYTYINDALQKANEFRLSNPKSDLRSLFADCSFYLGLIISSKDIEKAKTYFAEYHSISKTLVQEDSIKYLSNFTEALFQFGYILLGKETSLAKKYLEEALEKFHVLTVNEHQNCEGRISDCLNFLGAIFADSKDLDAALERFNASLKIRKKLAEGGDSVMLSLVSQTLRLIGDVYIEYYFAHISTFFSTEKNKKERHDKLLNAIKSYEQAFEILKKITEKDDQYKIDFAHCLQDLGWAMKLDEQIEEGKKNYIASIEIINQLSELNPYQYLSSLAYSYIGFAKKFDDDLQEVLGNYEKAIQIFKDLSLVDSKTYLPTIAKYLTEYGRRLDDKQKTLDAFNEGLKIRRVLAEDDTVTHVNDLVESLEALGIFFKIYNDISNSKIYHEEAVLIRRKVSENNSDDSKVALSDTLTHYYCTLRDLKTDLNFAKKLLLESYSIILELVKKNPSKYLEKAQYLNLGFAGYFYDADQEVLGDKFMQYDNDIIKGLNTENTEKIRKAVDICFQAYNDFTLVTA